MSKDTSNSTLVMSGITRSFPGVVALQDVTFTANHGEVVGLVGVNGAGKSTLMNILGGLLQPDSGFVSIDGKPARFKSPIDANRQGIAFIHQELVYFATQTVAENIYMNHLPMFSVLPFVVDRKTAINKAQAVLDSLGVKINAGTAMEKLSVGQIQLVELARAVASGARIVIFDEPTSSLSIREKEILFDVVRTLRRDDKTIIYISHFIDEILELCDRFTVLRNGMLSGSGDVAGTTKSDIIQLVIGKEPQTSANIGQASTGRVALEVENLSARPKLENISFKVHQGEVLGLWGLMGAGRTELMRALLGLDAIDSGHLTLEINGSRETITPYDLLSKAGYITENRRVDGLFLGVSLWKNTTVTQLRKYAAGVFRFMQGRKEMATAARYVKDLSIKTPDSKTDVANLSGGNQQKVILAKWLNKKPQILFLDEPTRGVDVGAKHEISQLVTQLASEGSAIILVTSELEELTALCHRVLVLRNGKIVQSLSGDEIEGSRLMSMALGEDSFNAA